MQLHKEKKLLIQYLTFRKIPVRFKVSNEKIEKVNKHYLVCIFIYDK